MHRLIFLNLPVADLDRSKRFYTGLGFPIDERFSDDTAAAVVVSDTIVVMLLTREKFADLVSGAVGDPRASTTSTACLSASSREEVDSLASRALAGGGRPWLDVTDQGPLYGTSFCDPDGHVWEVLHTELAPA